MTATSPILKQIAGLPKLSHDELKTPSNQQSQWWRRQPRSVVRIEPAAELAAVVARGNGHIEAADEAVAKVDVEMVLVAGRVWRLVERMARPACKGHQLS